MAIIKRHKEILISKGEQVDFHTTNMQTAVW